MNGQEIKYQRAKKRVEALRGFYIHLGVYIVVNLLLFLINISLIKETTERGVG